MIRAITIASLLLATSASAGTLDEDLGQLEKEWTFVCVRSASDEPDCPAVVQRAVQHLREGFADAKRHEALDAAARVAISACGDNLKAYASKSDDVADMVAKISACSVHVYETTIEKKGGLLEYLIWYESLGDPEV